jgi:CheY-like chemotaxis protein
MLRDLGYAHVRVAEGVEALTTLASGDRFDLVFSDMVMPGELDGLALAREVRRLHPGLPVILTTGFSEAASAAAAANFPLLPKPYGIDALAAVLAETLAGTRGDADIAGT